MAEFRRPLMIALAAGAVLIVLLLMAPHPKPIPRSDTPFAPLSQIEKARQASAISDAANAKLQAASEQAGR